MSKRPRMEQNEGGSGAMRSETGLELGSEGLAGHGKEFGCRSTWEWKPQEGFEQEKNMIWFSVCEKTPSGC